MNYCFLCVVLLAVLSSIANRALSQSAVTDSMVSPASTQYSNTSFLGRLISGSNYRKEWSTPVAMPVFYLKGSGYTIKELGGGMQTKSLRLIDKNKREWVLRSVEKDVEGAVPKKFRWRIIVDFVQDQVSASHPYAPLVVDYLARANHIIAPKPVLYYVAEDETFGEYKTLFARTVCFLEQREPTPDNSDTKNTEKVMEDIIGENHHLVLQEVVLKARLLDMLIGDWDRHADQWRWGVLDTGDTEYYYAIPRDRDQAFFWTNGLLPKFIKIFAMKHINGFKKESKQLKNLNFKSWRFDKTFLNGLDRPAWERITKEFQARLTDTVIDNAVARLPKEIYAISGTKLKQKLKGRRNTLLENVMKYYEFVSNSVDISGTDEDELFEIKNQGTQLMVSGYQVKNNSTGKKIYERVFDKEDTRFINLNGFGGSDHFRIAANTSSEIKIKINGGKGRDIYDLKGNTKTSVYDFLSDKDEILNRSGAKIHLN